jgi:putative oxidoreductase
MKGILRFLSGGSRENAWGSLLLVRLLVGWVFLLAGLRKFTEPETMGAGRFAEMGFPWPGFVGPFVGFFEILGGALVLLGLFTRAGALPLVCTMIVAILTTKAPRFGAEGLVAGLHASRLDVSLLLASAYLLIAGGGKLALDRLLFPGRRP